MNTSGRRLWRRLFFNYALLGLFFIGLSGLVFYFYSGHAIEERSRAQIVTARHFCAEKIKLYLENLKILAVEASRQSPSDHRIKKYASKRLLEALDEVHVIPNRDALNSSDILSDAKNYPFEEFFWGHGSLSLKVKRSDSIVLWKFNTKGLNHLLAGRQGLGSSGEIYLVGADKKIKSPSRFIQSWQKIMIDNRPVQLALAGESGTEVALDYRGIEVLSSFTKFQFDKLEFALLVEIDWDEIMQSRNLILFDILKVSTLFLAFTIMMAFFISRSIVGKMDKMNLEISTLSLRLMKSQDDERRRISMDLHDGLGQYLTSLKWKLSMLKHPKMDFTEEVRSDLVEICDSMVGEIRSLSNELAPTFFKELGFFNGIGDFLRKQGAFHHLKINYYYPESLKGLEFIEGLEVNLFRMIQELLQNSIKHSGANEISVTFYREKKNIVLMYEDNGSGMIHNQDLPRSLTYRASLVLGSVERVYNKQSKLLFKIQVPLRNIGHENKNLHT